MNHRTASIATVTVALLLSGVAHAESPLLASTGGDTTAGAAAEPLGDDRPFAAGTWDWHAYAGAVQEAFGGNGETMYFGTVNVERFIMDDLSLGGEFVGYGVEQNNPDSAGGGFNLMLRWHPIKLMDERIALYVEGSAGVAQFTRRTPTPNGTHFNFIEQVGAGAKCRLTDDIGLIGGARYLHLSNAGINGEDRNPSIDGFGGYGGLTIRF